MSTSLRIVLILLFLSLIGLALSGLTIYARLSYLWGSLLVVSWIWSRVSLRGVELERTTRTLRANVGQVFEERFELRNEGWLPRLWIEIGDRSDLPGSRGSRVLTRLGAEEQRIYRVRTRLVQRGIFSLGPTNLASGDLFGLFPVRRTVPSTSSLLVYPLMVDVESFPSPPGVLPGGEALRLRTHQVTPNASGVRDYVPGDPLNRIHWLSSARRNRLIVKEFELDPLAEVWIFLDAEASVQAEQPYSPPNQAVEAIWSPWREVTLPPSTEEYGVTVAASLARYFLRRDRAVGLISCHKASQRTPDLLPPDRGGRQLGKILEALAPLRAEGDLPVSALIAAHGQHMPRGSTVIVITPSVDREVALAVDTLARRGLRPVVVLIDAASFGGKAGTKELAHEIAAFGVPVSQIGSDTDVARALSVEMNLIATRQPGLRRGQIASHMGRS